MFNLNRKNRRSRNRSQRCRFEPLEERQLLAVLASENFNSVELGPPVDEVETWDYIPEAWTKTPPDGWTIDDSGVPGAGDPDNDGYTEWAGWSFASKDFWGVFTDDQDRTQFVKGTGTVAVVDPDEWDDKDHAAGTYNSYLETPVIELPGNGTIAENSAYMSFDSSWRPEDDQKVKIEVRYSLDGGATFGAPIEILRWESDSASAYFHGDAQNESIEALSLQNPANATHVQVTFGIFEAGNDWWWAIDNISMFMGTPAGPATSRYVEDFEGVTLGSSVDETIAGFQVPNVWTETGPTGWTVDDSGVPGAGDLANDGVTEWAGWAFVQKDFWVTVAEDQGRNAFTGDNPNNTIALVDPDEWDDATHDPGTYNAFMTSEAIDLTVVNSDLLDTDKIAQLHFDSSWLPEDDQKATIEVSYDGGTTWTEIDRWTSDAADPDYKGGATNETAEIDLPDPGGASEMLVRFGMIDAADDWWWAIDNVEVVTRDAAQFSAPFFTEDFEGLPLGPPVDENGATPPPVPPSDVWSGTPPTDWTVDNTGVPGYGTDNDGVTEWAGWTYADPQWWDEVAEDQNRSQFMKGDQVVAIADSDEWDDLSHEPGTYNTFLMSPSISLAGVTEGTAQVTFDSSFRPESEQDAYVEVSFDGGTTWSQVLFWDSTSGTADYHDHEEDETVTVDLNNPAGATDMIVSWSIQGADNNWWWAIDNVRVTGDMTADAHSWAAGAGDADWSDEASWSGTGTPDSPWTATLENTDAAGGKTAIVNADSDITTAAVSGTVGPMTLLVEEGVELGTEGVALGDQGRLAGSGQVVGDVTFTGAGTIAPGMSSGNLDIAGNVGANGNYELEIGNTYAFRFGTYEGTLINGDYLDVTGTIDLSGTETLDLSFIGSADPADLIKAGTYVLMVGSDGFIENSAFETISDLGVYDDGTFNDVNGGILVAPLTALGYDTDEPVSAVVFTITQDLVAGDANLDGVVDQQDIDILNANFMQSGDWSTGDFNGDGVVDGTDRNIMLGEGGLENLYLQGTEGDDVISIKPGIAGTSMHEVSINGTVTTYDPAVYDAIYVDGLGGNDRAGLYGLDGSDDTFYGMAAASRMEVGTIFIGGADNVETVYGYAGTSATAGGDVAHLGGTVGDDTFVASDGSSYVAGGGYLHATRQFDAVEADVTGSGGTDKAYFDDTAGDDNYYGQATEAWIALSSGVVNKAVGFGQTRVTSSGSATAGDKAFLTGADGQDKFIARFDIGYMFGTGYLNSAAGFDYVEADVSGTTGEDWAYFVGTAGDDTYYGAVDESRMELSNGVVNKSIGFPNHYALAEGEATGDVAYLSGSAGDDVFVAGDGYAYTYGAGVLNSTRNFETVEADVTADGHDSAALHGTAGVDRFYGGLSESRIELSTGVVNKAFGAFDTVYAYGTSGDGDEAYLAGTAGDDTFVGRDGSAYIVGSGKVNSLRQFDYVEADVAGSGGSDTANFYDSAAADLFTADGDDASFDLLNDGDLDLLAHGFARVNANSDSGTDVSDDDQAYNYALYYYGTGWE